MDSMRSQSIVLLILIFLITAACTEQRVRKNQESSLSATRASQAVEEQPNFVVLFADDLGFGDVGSYGATDIATPYIDELASGGVRFTTFYSASPVCSPSRAALLTGKYPERAGVPANVGNGIHDGLPPTQITLAEALAPSG